jgi:hypothetical protein
MIHGQQNIKKHQSFSSCRYETELEVNADKTEYMMSQDQNAGQSHSMKTGNSSFEKVEEFKYLGTNQKQIEVKECLLSFSAESFVF